MNGALLELVASTPLPVAACPAPFMPLRAQRVRAHAVDEAETKWTEAGKPDCTRYGVSVTPEGQQQVWFDSPDNVIG